MLERFFPQRYYSSTLSIDFADYYKIGYRGILFDIDNTLAPHNGDPSEQVIELFEQLKKMGFKICLISNNSEARVQRFNQIVHVKYISMAWKPSRKNYRKAMKEIGTDTTNTLFIGDQIFTDIWGANRAGLFSILVEPIQKKEELQIILKRFPEKLILNRYKKHRMNKKVVS